MALLATPYPFLRERLHETFISGMAVCCPAQITSGGKIHITLDGWAASNGVPYLGITAHWLGSDFAMMHDIGLDFVRLHGSHSCSCSDDNSPVLRNPEAIGVRYV